MLSLLRVSDTPQPLSLLEAILPVASLVMLVGLSYFLFGDAGASGPNQVALVVATMIAVFIGWRRGYSLESLGKAASESVSTGISAIFILFAVGGLIGTWALSGLGLMPTLTGAIKFLTMSIWRAELGGCALILMSS